MHLVHPGRQDPEGRPLTQPPLPPRINGTDPGAEREPSRDRPFHEPLGGHAAIAGQLANQLKISPLLAQCLLNRDLSEATSIGTFLQPRLKQLADPFLLPNMAAAVDRLLSARERAEPLSWT